MPARYALCGEGLCIGYDGGDAVSERVHAAVRVHRAARSSRSSSTWPTIAYVDVERHMAAAMARD